MVKMCQQRYTTRDNQWDTGEYKLGSESDGHTQGEKTGERDRSMLM